ncbi:MAG: GTP-binding protein [Candidatus Lokiarchaeota archaeon]|nr:GTP-binding protein [Candidatus Lokiarchaeota archaeon]
MNISDQNRKIYKFKVTLFGAGNVGKTSLILRFIKESFSDDLKKTIGTNFLIKDVDVGDVNVRLLVWDIGGQSSFSSMRSVYFKGSNACIGVYDITSPESLLKIPGWLSSIKKSVGSIPMILLGNKYDLAPEQQRVDEKDALDLSERLDCTHQYTSAKSGDGVEEAFMEIATKCLNIARQYEHED